MFHQRLHRRVQSFSILFRAGACALEALLQNLLDLLIDLRGGRLAVPAPLGDLVSKERLLFIS